MKPLSDWLKLRKMYPNQFNLINDRVVEVKTVVVHKFTIPDAEDPEIYVAEPIWHWQQSEAGKWVMDHAVDQPEWRRQIDPGSYSYQYVIVAKLTDRDYTFWALKWANQA